MKKLKKALIKIGTVIAWILLMPLWLLMGVFAMLFIPVDALLIMLDDTKDRY